MRHSPQGQSESINAPSRPADSAKQNYRGKPDSSIVPTRQPGREFLEQNRALERDMSRPCWERTSKLVLALTGIYAILLLLIDIGALDLSSVDRVVTVSASGALITYWILSCFAVLVFAFIKKRWKECCLLFFTVISTLIIAEIVLRVLLPTKAMKSLQLFWSADDHHLHLANEELCLIENGRDSIFTSTNEDGFRTAYSTREFKR